MFTYLHFSLTYIVRTLNKHKCCLNQLDTMGTSMNSIVCKGAKSVQRYTLVSEGLVVMVHKQVNCEQWHHPTT